MIRIFLTFVFVTMTGIAGTASAAPWNSDGRRLESGTRPAEACRLIFIYARNGTRISFNDNSAMADLTAKCNLARSHEFGLHENDCAVTQFLLGMVHQEMAELTCRG
jgi:hypothetical protein